MAKVHLQEVEDCSVPCSASCNCGINPDCAGPIEQEMKQHFQVLHDLCNQLEEIADALPENVDGQKMLTIARRIFPTVKTAHYFEEMRIFPHIRVEAEAESDLSHSLERLQYEHWEDESFAEEVLTEPAEVGRLVVARGEPIFGLVGIALDRTSRSAGDHAHYQRRRHGDPKPRR